MLIYKIYYIQRQILDKLKKRQKHNFIRTLQSLLMLCKKINLAKYFL